MGEMSTCIRKGTYGQRLKRYPLSSIVRPCTMLDNEFDQMSNSLLRGTTSIRGRYKAEAVFDERRSTAGIEQERQKDTSGKRGTAFCFCKVVVNKMQQSAIKSKLYKKNNY